MCLVPDVSVVVSVCHSEKYLSQCLDSIIQQTLKNIEIICVDGGSSIDSLRLLQQYAKMDSRIVVLSKDIKSVGALQNCGLDVARGKYVYFIDSNDYCDANLLDHALCHAQETGAEMVAFDYYEVHNWTEHQEYISGVDLNRLSHNAKVFSYKDQSDEICSLVNPVSWNRLFLRTFLMAIGLRFSEPPQQSDIVFTTLTVLKATNIAYVREGLIYHRMYSEYSTVGKEKEYFNNIVTSIMRVDRQAHELTYYKEIKSSLQRFCIRTLFATLERYPGTEDEADFVALEKTIDAMLLSYPLFAELKRQDLYDDNILDQVIIRKRRAFSRNDFSFGPRIIVSMTSFPARIATTHLAIRSIMLQTRQPDRVILWLSKLQFPAGENGLPQKLLDYKKLGLQIVWCEDDIKPHKKYVYTMQQYPQDIVITVDDDLIFEPQMIEMLLQSYYRFPWAVSCMRAHLMTETAQGNIASYSKWEKEYSGIVGQPSHRLFATTGAGTLFPPYCLPQMAFDINAIKMLCLNADDLWLKVMQTLNDVPVVLVSSNKPLQIIQGTQKGSLREKNLYENGNDMQLARILERYDVKDENGQSMIAKKIFSDQATWETDLLGDFFDYSAQSGLQLMSEIERAEREKKEIQTSFSYRLGKGITWVPRKIRGVLRCCNENGYRYTWNHLRDKVRRLFRV